MIADRKEERTVNDYLIFHYISCFSSTRLSDETVASFTRGPCGARTEEIFVGKGKEES